MLNKDGAVYVGARAVVIPARTGTTREPTTRQVVVASDHKSFTLDDGHTYHRLSGAVWSKRYSVDIGTLKVRQAYTEGAALFASLWRSATDPAPRTAEEIKAAWPYSYGEITPSTGNVLAVRPGRALKPGHAYRLKFAQGLLAAEGNLGLLSPRDVI